MSTAIERKVSGRSSISNVEVRIDLEQRPGSPAARGRFRLVDQTSKTTIEMTEPGLLQVAPGWAAVTGRGRFGAGERAFTVIVEQADPLDENHGTTVTVLGEEGYQLTRLVNKGSLRVSPSRPLPPDSCANSACGSTTPTMRRLRSTTAIGSPLLARP